MEDDSKRKEQNNVIAIMMITLKQHIKNTWSCDRVIKEALWYICTGCGIWKHGKCRFTAPYG